MIRRLSALMWLRSQILLSNSNTLIQVLFPFGLVLLFDTFMNTDKSQGQQILYSCLTMAFSFSAGTIISNTLAEEKEKNILKSLILGGVRQVEYLISVLFYPLCFVLLAIISFPLMLGVELKEQYPTYLLITFLVATATVLLNLFIGAIAKTQTQAQVYGLVPMLCLTFLPMFAQVSSEIKTIMDYTFLGIYADFFNEKDFVLTLTALVPLLLWLLVLFLASVWAVSGRKLPLPKWQRKASLVNKIY